MALFFDRVWFDGRLESAGRSLDDIAALLQLSGPQVQEIWKDQRELSPQEVGALAEFLQVTPAEIADHAGVSTPVPVINDAADMSAIALRLDEMNARLIRMEQAMAQLTARVLEQPPSVRSDIDA